MDLVRWNRPRERRRAPASFWPTINNIVVRARTAAGLPLEAMTNHFGCEFNPASFNKVIIRFDDPKSTLSVFRTGNIVCVGCQEESAPRRLFLLFCHLMLVNFAMEITVKNITVGNMVADSNVGFLLNLPRIWEDLAGKLARDYQPKRFPGCKLVILVENGARAVGVSVFMSGKCNFYGARTYGQLVEACDRLWAVLQKYRADARTIAQPLLQYGGRIAWLARLLPASAMAPSLTDAIAMRPRPAKRARVSGLLTNEHQASAITIENVD
jgi:TATA-box binding protein (TBP) (component of TFIID and TFIIIB)